MRLTSMTIKNFKGIDEQGVRIDFAPITLLFGPNNAGKSTVMQALHLAQEVLCHPQADYDNVDVRGKGMDLGSFKNYVHKHELNREVSIRLDMDVEGLPVSWDSLYREQWEGWREVDAILDNVEHIAFEFMLNWDSNKQRSILSGYRIFINKKTFAYIKIDYCHDEYVAYIYYRSPVCFFSQEKLAELTEQYSLAISHIHDDDDKCESLLSDVEDNAKDNIHPLIFPFIEQNWLSHHFFSITSLGITTRNKPIVCPLGKQPGFTWGTFLPLEYADIVNDDSYLDVSRDFMNNCLSLFSSLVLSPCKLMRDLLNTLLYIGPLRSIPARGAFRAQKPSAARWADGLAAWDALATLPGPQIAAINQHLHGESSLQTGYTVRCKHLLALDVESPLVPALRKLVMDDIDEGALPLLRDFLAQAPETRLMLRNEATGVELEPHDMGVGISQVLPVVVAATTAKRGALVAIEQPELHIHPAWQTAIGDVFIKALAGQDSPPMFLLETHSEHLMLRLLRRIRETHDQELPEGFSEVYPEMISVLYVQPDAGERTEIIRLPVTPNGDFARKWPNGFFAERAEELF